MLWVALFIPLAPMATGETMRRVFAETDELLPNPGMGWQTFHRFADEDPNLGGLPSMSAYFRFYWRELEPVEGQIDFVHLDALLARARRAGQRLALRVMCAGTNEQEMYVPEWLRAKGCPGFSYQYEGQGPTHWVPDMDSPIFLDAHLGFIERLAERYDGHPDIDLLDIGTVGLWGEWHMSGTGVDVPSWATRRRIINAWMRAFPRMPKVMLIGDAEGLSYAAQNGCGWRADCLGDMGGFSKTWNHMEHFYRQQLERTMTRDVWRTAPVAFESCWDMRKWVGEGWDVGAIFDYALDLHASYVNNKSAPIPPDAKREVERLLRRLGYRIVIRSVEHPDAVYAGAALPIHMEWGNVGVAPPYRDDRVAVRLRNTSSTHVAVTTLGPPVRGWTPGTIHLDIRLSVPEDAPAGDYALEIALLPPDSQEPVIRLANEGRQSDGWYCVGAVRVAERPVER